MKKSVSGGWKAIVLILLFLSELIICAGILGNMESVCNFLTAHLSAAVPAFLHRTLYFLIEVAAAVLLVVDTMILGITKATRKFPSLMTVLAFIYNDIAVIATVFGLYLFGQPRTWFQYPLVFLIPAITFVLALICLIDDFVHDEGIADGPVNVTKIAGQQAVAPQAPKAQAEPVEAAPKKRAAAPKAPEEPAFFVTPAPEEQWAEQRAVAPEVVPATESVQMSARETAPAETMVIDITDPKEDAKKAVDDMFAAFLGSDYVEDE